MEKNNNKEQYTFFYGNQAVEFERLKVPKIIRLKGLQANIKSPIIKAVITNVHN